MGYSERMGIQPQFDELSSEERFEERIKHLEARCDALTARLNEWQPFIWRKSEWQQQFDSLVAEWRRTRGHSSKIKDLVMNPAYQRIIGMGEPVVPLILAEMERVPDHWSWALASITGEDPVPQSVRGRLDETTAAWLHWAREKGYR